ncbi:MAG: glycoside hydrolase family 57 [Pseudomonadota bacterium]|nr:glycoside hydrolase family 57 [Pseudomonadota bacterium]
MIGTNVFHALGLHMHQPPGNLKLLIETNAWEAEQIIRCYERAARYALEYRDVAHLHVGFSGVLLEQLRDPAIVDSYQHLVDIPEMLARYREAENVELIGMGYYHPIFPLIPKADWDEQLASGRAIMEDTFGRAPRGFWPPEMAFSMDMVPALARSGYEYVVVDGVHVWPEDGLNDIYRPYLACCDGVCITVVPRDRAISNGQESGLDPGWFARESLSHTQSSPRPGEQRLVTTWSDGENGGWFRQLHEPSGFFGHFFSPYMEQVRRAEFPVIPVSLSDYLHKNPPGIHAQVQTGAWNVGSTSGYDFSQWAGSESQRKAAAVIQDLSRRYWDLRRRESELGEAGRRALSRARSLILEAQTSCFLFWGDAWIPQLYERTVPAQRELEHAEQDLGISAGAGALSPPGDRPRAPTDGV